MRWFFSFVVALLLALPCRANAQEEPAERPPIAAAAEAWEIGEITKAGKLYEQALAAGGLSPSDTLSAFVRMGVWRAVTFNKDAALNAFRNAATIDPSFEYPAEAGPKALPLYEKARKEAAGRTKVEIEAKLPSKLERGKAFHVVGSVPEAMTPFFDSMSVRVLDEQGKELHYEQLPIDTSVDFEVPGDKLRPGAKVQIQIAALDPQRNEWARVTRTEKVKSAPMAPATTPMPADPLEEDAKADDSGEDFWATKWPFVVGGGALLTVVGTIVVVAVASSGSDVATISAPSWQAASNSR